MKRVLGLMDAQRPSTSCNSVLWKYRSLSNLERIHDILLNQRVYLPNWIELNDHAEGEHRTAPESYTPPDKFRILSLSGCSSHPLLWGHYANGGNGVAIAMTLSDEVQLEKVDYIKNIADFAFTSSRDAFLKKSRSWAYEKEWRVIYENNNDLYSKVKIHGIVFGTKVDASVAIPIVLMMKKSCPDSFVGYCTTFRHEVNGWEISDTPPIAAPSYKKFFCTSGPNGRPPILSAIAKEMGESDLKNKRKLENVIKRQFLAKTFEEKQRFRST